MRVPVGPVGRSSFHGTRSADGARLLSASETLRDTRVEPREPDPGAVWSTQRSPLRVPCLLIRHIPRPSLQQQGPLAVSPGHERCRDGHAGADHDGRARQGGRRDRLRPPGGDRRAAPAGILDGSPPAGRTGPSTGVAAPPRRAAGGPGHRGADRGRHATSPGLAAPGPSRWWRVRRCRRRVGGLRSGGPRCRRIRRLLDLAGLPPPSPRHGERQLRRRNRDAHAMGIRVRGPCRKGRGDLGFDRRSGLAAAAGRAVVRYVGREHPPDAGDRAHGRVRGPGDGRLRPALRAGNLLFAGRRALAARPAVGGRGADLQLRVGWDHRRRTRPRRIRRRIGVGQHPHLGLGRWRDLDARPRA